MCRSSQRDEHTVTAAEVVMDRGHVALTGRPYDLSSRHRVDATLGEETRRRIEQLLACGRHDVVTT